MKMTRQFVSWRIQKDNLQENFSHISTSLISLGVALFVYIAGGIAYNRIVHHARGLKQIPNYHSWVEAFDFIKVSRAYMLCAHGFVQL